MMMKIYRASLVCLALLFPAALGAQVTSERLLRAGRPLSSDESKLVKLAERCRLANVRERLNPILDSFRTPDDSGGGSPS